MLPLRTACGQTALGHFAFDFSLQSGHGSSREHGEMARQITFRIVSRFIRQLLFLLEIKL
jgi:hypothetical protein